MRPSLLAYPAIGLLAVVACESPPPTIDPLPPLEWNTEPRVPVDEPLVEPPLDELTAVEDPADAGPPPPVTIAEPELEPAVADPELAAAGLPVPEPQTEIAPPEHGALEDGASAVEDERAPVAAEASSEAPAIDPARDDELAALEAQVVALQDEIEVLRAQQASDRRDAELGVLLTSIVAAETAAYVIALTSQSLAPAQLAPSRAAPSRSAPAMSQSRKSAR